MKERVLAVVVEVDESGVFLARVPELQGCHTFAPTMELLRERLREVIELCLEEDDYSEVDNARFHHLEEFRIVA